MEGFISAIVHICVSEDRQSEADAVRLLLCSIRQNAPSARITISVFCPFADEVFSAWARRFGNINLRCEAIVENGGWNIKPAAMLRLFEEGADHVLWIDSDIVVTRDISDILERVRRGCLIAAQEPRIMTSPGSAPRTRGWGLPVGKMLQDTVNSGVVGASRRHIPLLEEWRSLLDLSDYRAAQATDFDSRPIHFRSDQDVLTALLGSRQYADLDLRLLRSGRDIVQYVSPAAYGLGDRLRHVFRAPPYFVHAMRRKPWRWQYTPNLLRSPGDYWDALLCETSPYRGFARRVARLHGLRLDWAERRSLAGALIYPFGGFHPALAGAPLSLADRALRLISKK